jgi:hypothetical protein
MPARRTLVPGGPAFWHLCVALLGEGIAPAPPCRPSYSILPSKLRSCKFWRHLLKLDMGCFGARGSSVSLPKPPSGAAARQKREAAGFSAVESAYGAVSVIARSWPLAAMYS